MTGLLRICCHTVHRDDVNEEVLQSLKILYPSEELQPNAKQCNFDRQLAEGDWRICCDGVDDLRSVNTNGWQGILGLIKWHDDVVGVSGDNRDDIILDGRDSIKKSKSE